MKKLFYRLGIFAVTLLISQLFSFEIIGVLGVVLAIISYGLGGYIYTQRNGIQVTNLNHFHKEDLEEIDHSFKVKIIVKSKALWFEGLYVRFKEFGDIELQAKLFRHLNDKGGTIMLNNHLNEEPNEWSGNIFYVDDSESNFGATNISLRVSEN